MKKTTAKWVRKAEADRVIALQSAESKKPLHDGVCFHCQQCAEKYLKGLLEERGLLVPKTHDLELLRPVLLPFYPALRSLRRGCEFLTQFARSEEHTSELQSPDHLVCRLLLEKKKKK